MAGYATLQQLLQAIEQPFQRYPQVRTPPTAYIASSWVNGSIPIGVAPTTAVVPTNNTAGAVGQRDGSGVLRLVGIACNLGVSPGWGFIADRLSHQGGLDATVTGVQSTNLPTAALTRYTSGEGVYIGLEIYTLIGATGTTITVNYTNTGGGASVSPPTSFGATGFREAGRFLQVPLAQGDTGVLSVQSVNIVATTGTAGNFGVVLYKPLMPYMFDQDGMWLQNVNSPLTFGACVPEIVDGACLWLLYGGTSAQGLMNMEYMFAEDP